VKSESGPEASTPTPRASFQAEHISPSFERVAKIAHVAGVSVGWVLEESGFSLTDEQRAKVRTAGVLLLNLTGGLPKA
jgi:hypothetical protein